MKNYIICSSKPWNKDLAHRLNVTFGRFSNFTLCTHGDELHSTIKECELYNPVKGIFFPHWNWVVPKEIHEKYECIIFHTGYLPLDRGMEPIQHLIERGEIEAPLNALKCVENVDAGPIYLSEMMSLHGSAEEVYLRLDRLCESMIHRIIAGNYELKKQEGAPAIFERRKKKQSDIEQFKIKKLTDLYNHIRMLDASGYNHAYLETDHFRLEFRRATLRTGEVVADVTIKEKI